MKIVNFKKDPLLLKSEIISKLEMLLDKVKNDDVKSIVIGAYFGDSNAFTCNIDDNGCQISPLLNLSLCSILLRLAQDNVIDVHQLSSALYPPEE
jgi:hypothetical protein